MTVVAAVDCGPRSGFAWGEDGNVLGTCTVPVGPDGYWPLNEKWQVDQLLLLVKEKGAGVVVIEDFILRLPVGGTQREGLSSARIGFALYTGLKAGSALVSVRWQQPADMKLVRGKVVGRNEHERDANRHLQVYWRKEAGTRLV